MPTYDYDLITLGAGSGGVRATRLAGGYGAKTVIVEESRVGGTCVMRGCIPKKLLVFGAHFADDFEDAVGYGWIPGEPAFDWPTLIANKNTELERLEGVYHRILRDNGVRLIEGSGVLADAHTIEIGGKTFTAEKILVACGGWPTTLDIPGVEHVITSNELSICRSFRSASSSSAAATSPSSSSASSTPSASGSPRSSAPAISCAVSTRTCAIASPPSWKKRA